MTKPELIESRFCSRCGGVNNIESHHIVYRINGGSDDKSNLVDLCRACHDYRHTLEKILAHIERMKPKNNGRG